MHFWFDIRGLYGQTLKSPDGKFQMDFSLKNGTPYYQLKYNGKVVVEESKLGLRLFKDNNIQFASEINKTEGSENDLNQGFTKVSEKETLKMKPGSR